MYVLSVQLVKGTCQPFSRFTSKKELEAALKEAAPNEDLEAVEILGVATVGSNSEQAISISLSKSSVNLGDFLISKSAAEFTPNLKTGDTSVLDGYP